ncbi:anaerobic sulfatase maturase [Thaumasiovibrio subtropicus]|uniref:anaerobic sulfatase maturase n=1 Tax=Thaumasiovibrio subtropicus TaxID=1891207 RepID=UPI000B35CF07|nr:anaerobic sulfatase maturase [Thaumasiovibrio subtropicus]
MSPSNCHVMAKPTGPVCNLSCEYCFYLEKEKLYPTRDKAWQMSLETLEIYIRQTIDAQDSGVVNFAWQGGEPTMAGIEFFEHAMRLCDRYGEGKEIHHAFQTNGVLVDEQWCQFFKQHNVLVGISIDGPEALHDHYRVNRAGRGSHAKVVAAIELLKKHGVEFNILCVVNAENAKQPLEVYNYFKHLGAQHMQFIPLVERELQHGVDSKNETLRLVMPGEEIAKVTEWSVPAKAYGEFLWQIFFYWVRNDVGRIFVNAFDSTLSLWIGAGSEICHHQQNCGHAFILEANGDVYNCDHFVYPEHLLGNIHDTTIKAINQSSQAVEFGLDKEKGLSANCQHCPMKPLCNGGCPKHRFAMSKTGVPNHNYFCASYQLFFERTAPYMKAMRELIKMDQSTSGIMRLASDMDARGLTPSF